MSQPEFPERHKVISDTRIERGRDLKMNGDLPQPRSSPERFTSSRPDPIVLPLYFQTSAFPSAFSLQPKNLLLQIQRAHRLFHRPDRDAVGIDHRRLEAGVTQNLLYDADIVICLQQVGGIGMAKGVGRDALADFCVTDCMVKRPCKSDSCR